MRKIKFFINALLAIIGITSCDKINTTPAEYGCPHATLDISGKVTSSDGKPIKGIQTIIQEEESEYYPRIKDTLYTDANGQYNYTNKDIFSIPEKLTITFKDIDNEENGGKFANKTENVNKGEYKQTEKASGWYKGKFELNKDVVLNKE